MAQMGGANASAHKGAGVRIKGPAAEWSPRRRLIPGGTWGAVNSFWTVSPSRTVTPARIVHARPVTASSAPARRQMMAISGNTSTIGCCKPKVDVYTNANRGVSPKWIAIVPIASGIPNIAADERGMAIRAVRPVPLDVGSTGAARIA